MIAALSYHLTQHVETTYLAVMAEIKGQHWHRSLYVSRQFVWNRFLVVDGLIGLEYTGG